MVIDCMGQGKLTGVSLRLLILFVKANDKHGQTWSDGRLNEAHEKSEHHEPCPRMASRVQSGQNRPQQGCNTKKLSWRNSVDEPSGNYVSTQLLYAGQSLRPWSTRLRHLRREAVCYPASYIPVHACGCLFENRTKKLCQSQLCPQLRAWQ